MKTNLQYWQWRSRKASLRAWRSICRRIYRDNYPEFSRSTLVAGVARSGTTWIGDIIASQATSRIMFEPFNPELVEAYRKFNTYQYMRPKEENFDLAEYSSRVFHGQIRHSWIDRQVSHPAPQYRVIKAVRANLMLKWLRRQYPDVSQVLVIRQPCAVVLSWMQLGWAADEDIKPILQQPKLVSDYLFDKVDLIEQAEFDEEKLSIIWCVSNLIPLTQFLPGEVHISFYEHMCTQPEIEIPRLFHTVNRNYEDSVFDFLSRPSTTARPNSAAVTGHNRVKGWQHKLSAKQIDRILSVVEAFGLGYLYGDSTLPITNLDVLMGSPQSHSTS